MAKKMSAVQIDAHIEKHASPKGLKIDLKKRYLTVRPILVSISLMISLLKPKWAAEINEFIRGMDADFKIKA